MYNEQREFAHALSILAAFVCGIGAAWGSYVVSSAPRTHISIREVETEARNVAQMATTFYVFTNRYPYSLNELAYPPRGMSPLIDTPPVDPWGTPFVLLHTPQCEVRSLGPDRAPSDDDIVVVIEGCSPRPFVPYVSP